jgi:hypothetical protein
MAVPATTLTLTDRLAVKLYATNSGGKTTTIHTQNGHLCQIITTFSTGITALNGLTAQVQYFQTGTSGTDFNISSTTATHTFNIPDASATARGLITTGTQTIAGAKTFSANPSINVAGQASLSILSSTGNSALIFGYVNNVLKGTIDINATEFKFASTINSTYKFQASGLGIASLIFNNTTNYSYTFPDATGTMAMLEGTQTFSGSKTFTGSATFNNTLGNSIILNYGAALVKGNTPSSTSGVWSNIYAAAGSNNLVIADDVNISKLQFQAASTYTYTFPSTTGTIALTSDLTGGTVTSVAALTIGTTGTDLSSSVANSTTTPVITLNVPTASATNRGALSSADWTTFNNKQSALTNPVTGTGTTNYLPKFTGASTIGDSAIFENGTNVGINTASPSSYTNLTTLTINGTNGSVIDLKTGNTLYGEIYSLANELRIDAVGASSVLKFLTNSVTRATLDASGNLGLGVTPSAWNSSAKVLEIAATGNFVGSNGADTWLAVNSYLDNVSGGTFRYARTGSFATFYSQTSGSHAWYTAPSGTAGNAITFTQAMTLTAAGSLGIGTSSPQLKLDLQNGNAGFYNNTASSGGAQLYLGDMNFSGGAYATSAPGIGAAYNSSQAVAGDLAFYIYASTASSRNEAMRIKGGTGNVLIGTTTDGGQKLQVRGASGTVARITDGTNNLDFYCGSGLNEIAATTSLLLTTNGATRLTIASTGAATFSSSVTATNITNNGIYYGRANASFPATSLGYFALKTNNLDGERGGLTVQVSNSTSTFIDALTINYTGAATFSGKTNVVKDIADYAFTVTNTNTSGYGMYLQAGGTNNAIDVYNASGATQIFKVSGTGAVTATSFFESSSIKGKDIIATNPLLALDIDVIKYTRKSDESKDIRYGYSAEQIHSLMPELTDKDVTAVKYLDVHTILISQLQQEIKELKAKMN